MKRAGSSPCESPYPKLLRHNNSILEEIIPGISNDVIPLIMKNLRWRDINSCLLVCKNWQTLTQKSFCDLNKKNQWVLKIIKRITNEIFPQHLFSPKTPLEQKLCIQLTQVENMKNQKDFSIPQQVKAEEIYHSLIQTTLKFLKNEKRNGDPIIALTGIPFTLNLQEEKIPQLFQHLIKTEHWEILFALIENGEYDQKKKKLEEKFLNYNYLFQQIVLLKNEEIATDVIDNILSQTRQVKAYQALKAIKEL